MWSTLYWLTGLLGSLVALVNILGANIYDIKQAQLHHQKALRPYSRRYRRRPLISVVILAKNSEAMINRCLDSLLSSKYRKFEVIVVDQASNDATSQNVKNFIKQHPNKSIRVCTQRKTVSKNKTWQYAVKRYVKGDLIMLMDLPLLVDKLTLSNTAEQFNLAEPDLLTINYKIEPAYTTAGLFQDFWLLLRNRARKASNQFALAYLQGNEAAIAGSKAAIRQILSNKRLNELKVRYASNVTVYGQALSFPKLISAYYQQQIKRLTAYTSVKPAERQITQALPMFFSLITSSVALMAPILVAYFSYLAIRLHQPDFLVMSWAILSLFLVFAIWEDEQLKLRQKAKYVALMPATYVWFYLMLFVQYVVVLTSFRSLRLRRELA